MVNARCGPRAQVLRGAGRVALFTAVACACVPGGAFAATAGAHLDWTYSHAETSSTDRLTGTTSGSSSDSYLQRYGLNYSASLYPNLLMRLGYIFDSSMSVAEAGGAVSRSSGAMTSPSIDLGLANPWFTASAGFRRFEQRSDPGERSPVRDTYNASFGVKEAERRPSFTMLFSRTLLYDEDRETQDMATDTTSVSTRYSPAKNIALSYRASVIDGEDRINRFESQSVGQSFRAVLSEDFLQRRVSLLGNYTLSHLASEYSVAGAGTGEVTLPVAPVQGISGAGTFGTDVPPDTPAYDTVVSKPLLVDGSVAQPTDINIGYTPQNQAPRNLGLVFASPTEVNLLYVIMNQDVSALAGSYLWDVYTSDDPSPIDSGPKRWTLWQQAAPAVFNAYEKRFEISVPAVTAQFIKVVTKPLLSSATVPNVDSANILVAELQAFNRVLAGAVAGKTMRASSQTYDLSLRTRILDVPLVHYDAYYWHTQSSPDGTSRYFFSNGITASHRFSEIFSGSARAGRSDNDEREGHRTTYQTGASLTATPLRSLSHSLVLSSSRSIIGNAVSTNWAAYLSNYLELYTGINVTVGAGTSESTSSFGLVSSNESLNTGVTVVPHRTFSLNLSHGITAMEQHGGDMQAIQNRTTTQGVGAAYTPFPALYLYASRGMTTIRGVRRDRSQSYSASWAPFAGGSLQASVGYTQETSYPADQTTETLSPAVSWRVNPRMYLSGSYARSRSESPLALSQADSYTINFRWLF